MYQEKDGEKVIFVNREKFKVDEDQLSGQALLALAGLGLDYDLFLAQGQDSQKIEPDDIVQIKNGLHFRVIIKVVPFG